MGDTDKQKWLVANKDPWAKATFLPMLLEGVGVCAFKATGVVATAKIGSFCANSTTTAYRQGMLPVASLGAQKIKGKEGGVFLCTRVHPGRLVHFCSDGQLVKQPSRRLLSEIEQMKALPPPSRRTPAVRRNSRWPGDSDDESYPL